MVSLFLSCSKADPPVDSAVSAAGTAAPEAAAAKTSAGEPSAYGLNPLAILEPGNAPLWFELGAEGPLLINAPGAASLTPFEPWPLARYAAGFLFRGDDLFLAVNRDGFLIFTPRRGEGSGAVRDGLALYRAADPLFWQRYTLGAFFFYRDFPAALLYRNDFFADPAAEAPSPRVWGLVPGTPYPAALELPAFDAFPPGAGWDIDALRQGQDGRWYYRGVQNPAASPAPRYLRTADLSQPGEETSLAAFQESARPESLAEAPPLLRLVLEEAFKLSGSSRFQTAAVLFPGLSGPRRFSPDSALNFSDEDLIELSGYYRDAGTGTLPDALAILEDGRGIYGKDRGAGFEIGPFVLPPLQEGFVYTGAAPAGTALIAAWEEQQGWNVGAAGFMVLK
ncbi:MAG: hypothetical protein LBP42_01595 [Treponema sp.]|nr:hypothetical protein [Treponema sp.]